jgi:hypothetical protein
MFSILYKDHDDTFPSVYRVKSRVDRDCVVMSLMERGSLVLSIGQCP